MKTFRTNPSPIYRSRNLFPILLVALTLGTSACYREEVAAEHRAELAAARAAEDPNAIPKTLQDTWRVSDGDEVSPDECREDEGFEANRGQIFTVFQDGYSSFENVVSLVETHEKTEDHIEGTFNTSFDDTTSQQRLALELDDVGWAMIIESQGDDGSTTSTRLVRCGP